MADQETPTWTAADFTAWRARMGWSMSQAAHVLAVSKPSVLAWENGTYPVTPHIAHMAESAEMLRDADWSAVDMAAYGQHVALKTRMAEAGARRSRGRPKGKVVA